MKVVQESKRFQPVTITIESQDELNWLMACLNISTSQAEVQWANMGYDTQHLVSADSDVAMSMYNAIYKLHRSI